MRLRLPCRFLLLALAAALLLAGSPAAGQESAQPVVLLTVEGPILPIVESYLDRGIARAEEVAGVAVLRLDTPGGLIDTTRAINARILSSRAPVVVYVSPRGARAASAGVYITYAAHLAAMAPGTHLGAATPVVMGGEGGEAELSDEMRGKLVNDMVAYLRNLAELRGRNAEWAEESVRTGASLTAEEAREAKVVELVAADLEALLEQAEGLKVAMEGGGSAILRPAPGQVEELPMSPAERFLLTISHPQVAIILLMIGVYGIIYGLQQPGTYVPEVLGTICLLLALWSLGNLPINYAGLGLMLLAAGLFVAEVKAPTHGALATLGVVAMILGGLLLVPEDYPYLEISKAVLLALTAFSAATIMLITGFVVRTLRRQPVSGREGLVGVVGRATSDLAPEGRVRVAGESWRARAVEPPISAGTRVRVVAMEGFTLRVEPATEEE